MSQILVFGDSNTYGAWDPDGGWVARLRKFVDEKNMEGKDYFVLIYNLGIDGDDSDGVLKRIENETLARQKYDKYEDTTILIRVGSNDSAFLKDKNSNAVSKEVFKTNLEQIFTKAKKLAKNVIFVGPGLVDESKTQPVSWDKNFFYSNKDEKEYGYVAKEVCDKMGVEFIEILSELEKVGNEKVLDDDGVHFNATGHEIIFNKVKQILINKKLI